MNTRRLYAYVGIALVTALVLLGAIVGGRVPLALGSGQRTADMPLASVDNSPDSVGMVPASTQAKDPLILSYAAKFVCLEPLQPGQVWYSTTAPLVEEKTEVLIHNPTAYPVTFYKKAVRAPLEDTPAVAPGKWKELKLEADYAVRVDCDDIAKLLTGNAAATFIGTYGIGVKVEGFVVIGIGPQVVAGTNLARYSFLDVTAEYSRGSEVLKKDIHYRPWWWWWWYPLPWRLGYAYQRIISIDATGNIDCRGTLYNALAQDVSKQITDPTQSQITLQALEAGRNMEPTTVANFTAEDPPALVALIGRCDKIDASQASVDYVLVSNKGPTDPNPHTEQPAQASQIKYPWIPGRWYDLTVVMPQNYSVDLDDYMRQWQSQRWIAAGETATTVQSALVYYFPWWCGWGHWWWWWNAGDCIDIGVGEGESIDVEQITPVRVFMPQWPPSTQ